ncbi:unnamed protein product [Gongylonema pulchrum]|uniref:Si:ch73-233k15.2 n=1 Tax=Gongylonema pulchrum TaxID=637853 RepID=A0A183DXZ8_9BILA|nr:unnamed protein product [Gongylonema pulchrum]
MIVFQFFAKKTTPSAEEQKRDMCKDFYTVYKAFVENRQNLINELRNTADESVRVKKNCSISTIAGSSVGIAGGTAAIVGTVVCPPLLVGGLAVAGLATASNLGTQLTEFIIFRKMVKKLELMSKYDIELMDDIENIYKNAVAANLVSISRTLLTWMSKMFEACDDGSQPENTATNDIPSLGFQLGAGGTKGVTALGLRSVGIEMVPTLIFLFFLHVCKI